ncbi:carboxylesterase/lipase family protein [Agrobacterium larrymoorei]|nr:carboxylesterase family protein [Agrobacterium larrymoorei]QYA09853.1 carboxylesterase family protein [Agrobacterium larrymoorei]
MIVETSAGRVVGFEENGCLAFLGVPYAAPIIPERRFMAPQPVASWKGIRPARELSPVCPQIPTYGPVGRAAASNLEFGTDFLTVNIRTPSLQGKAPVLVWIHGGGYAVGSANEPVLQSGAFAASGIVEVTVNYRLGALGFLHLDGFPDNRGLLDQIAALEWVRDNIAAFGGDPNRVTFAGRSAGGFSIAAVMAMPQAKGLFAKAMPQSGASTGLSTSDDARKLTHRLLERLQVTTSELIDLSLETLLIAQRDLCNESYEQHDFERDGSPSMLGVPFVPVIDGTSLPDHPENLAAKGAVAQVPMMIGCTTGEYVTHATAQPKDMSFEDAARLLHERVRPLGLSGSEIVDRYRQALPDHTPIGIWRAVAGDLVFQNPTTRFAALHARHQPVYKYLFGELEADELGAPHGAEVGHVWYRQGMDLSHLPERQRPADPDYAKMVHNVWTSFIRDDPPMTPAGEWSRFEAENPVVLRLSEEGTHFANDVFYDRTNLWNKVPR